MAHAQGHAVGMGAKPHKGKFLHHKNRIPEDSVQGVPQDHNDHHNRQDIEAGRPVTHSHYLDHKAHHADTEAGRPVAQHQAVE